MYSMVMETKLCYTDLVCGYNNLSIIYMYISIDDNGPYLFIMWEDKDGQAKTDHYTNIVK